MAASTATTLYTTDPLLGVDFGAKASTAEVKILTRTRGSDGHEYLYVKASEAIGSITTCIIGAAGSASTDAGSAGWTANVPGGAAAGEHFWAKRTTLA